MNKNSTRRLFDAAGYKTHTLDWTPSTQSLNSALRNELRTMRGRARHMEKNDPYINHFLNLVTKHVVGPQGFTFQSRIMNTRGRLKETQNKEIERLWKQWTKKRHCSICSQYSWLDHQRIWSRTSARDGDCIVLHRYPRNNPFGYAIQILEADHLDERYSTDVPGRGNIVLNGIEYDPDGVPVAYHIWRYHPNQVELFGSRGNERMRIPREQVIHAPFRTSPGQNRGYPWMTASMEFLHQLIGYAEAELVASRVAASKMAFFTSRTADGELPMPVDPEKQDENEFVNEAAPGQFDVLPPGYDVRTFNPENPNGNYSAFTKTNLRNAASGMNVAYHTLANDLEGVNFSSARVGTQEERDYWKEVQNWMIESFCEPIFEEWLKIQLINGNINNKTILDFDSLNFAEFSGRGWAYVDPLKEANANRISVEQGIKSRSEAIRERGRDPQEVFEEIAKEREQMAALNINIQDTETNEDLDADQQDDN